MAGLVGVSTARLGYEKVIYDYARPGREVLARQSSFDAAYDKAKQRRQERRTTDSHVRELRDNAPDLHDMTVDESLTLEETWTAYQKRTEDARRGAYEREEGYGRRNLGAAEALHKLARGPVEVEQFVASVWPPHREHVGDGMRIKSERIESPSPPHRRSGTASGVPARAAGADPKALPQHRHQRLFPRITRISRRCCGPTRWPARRAEGNRLAALSRWAAGTDASGAGCAENRPGAGAPSPKSGSR
jgi:hypothetical protein